MRFLKPGLTENQVTAHIMQYLYAIPGVEDVEDVIVSSGPNTWPNWRNFSDRIIKPGEIVFMDLAALTWNGYKSCYYRTYCVGKQPTQEMKDYYATALTWLYDSIHAVRPGATTRDIALKWPSAQEAWGYAEEDQAAANLWGHGLGLAQYDQPVISRIWSLDHPLEIRTGRHPGVRLPVVMGHEATGVVEAVGEGVERVRPGQPVLLNPIIECGSCGTCVRGHGNLCANAGLFGREMDGSLAEHIVLPEAYLYPLPAHLPLAAATLIETLATVRHAQQRARIASGDSVVVLGQGVAGLLHTQLAKLSGARPVIAVSRSAWKLELARRRNADRIVNSTREDAVAAVRDATAGRGADVVVDAAGDPALIAPAIEMLAPGGRLLLYGISHRPVDGFTTFPLYYKELTVYGSRARSRPPPAARGGGGGGPRRERRPGQRGARGAQARARGQAGVSSRAARGGGRRYARRRSCADDRDSGTSPRRALLRPSGRRAERLLRRAVRYVPRQREPRGPGHRGTGLLGVPLVRACAQVHAIPRCGSSAHGHGSPRPADGRSPRRGRRPQPHGRRRRGGDRDVGPRLGAGPGRGRARLLGAGARRIAGKHRARAEGSASRHDPRGRCSPRGGRPGAGPRSVPLPGRGGDARKARITNRVAHRRARRGRVGEGLERVPDSSGAAAPRRAAADARRRMAPASGPQGPAGGGRLGNGPGVCRDPRARSGARAGRRCPRHPGRRAGADRGPAARRRRRRGARGQHVPPRRPRAGARDSGGARRRRCDPADSRGGGGRGRRRDGRGALGPLTTRARARPSAPAS